MPHVWLYEIDWGNTAAGFSALIAAGVACWTAWWSWDTRRREGLAKLAGARLAWIESFRMNLAEFMGRINVAGAHFIAGSPIDYSPDEKAKHLALYHRLLMDLPVGDYHLEELRKAIYAVLGDHTDTAAFGKAIQDLEFTATAVFATERQSALRELNGETIAIAVDMKHSR